MKGPLQATQLLKIDVNALYKLISTPHYHTYQIPKKGGGFRLIEAPDFKLKLAQRSANRYLTKRYLTMIPQNVHGFVPTHPGKSTRDIRSNALPHVGKKYVLNIDIKDFFHAIDTHKIIKALSHESLFLNRPSVYAFALLICYKKKLPMGAPSSPTISNVYCIELDKQLLSFGQLYDLTYTRYADDLTFSSNATITPEIQKELFAIINRFGFEINLAKKRLQSKHGAQRVTGIKVNEKLNVDRTYIRNIRAVLHSIVTLGWQGALEKHNSKLTPSQRAKGLEHFKNRIHGKITYVGYIKGKTDSTYLKLSNQWQTLVKN